jgi:hypothetical protein
MFYSSLKDLSFYGSQKSANKRFNSSFSQQLKLNDSNTELKLEPSTGPEILLTSVSDKKSAADENLTDEAIDLDGINYGQAKNNTFTPSTANKKSPKKQPPNFYTDESKYKKKGYYNKNSGRNVSTPATKPNNQPVSNTPFELSLDKSLGSNTNSLMCFKEALVPLINQQQGAKTSGYYLKNIFNLGVWYIPYIIRN